MPARTVDGKPRSGQLQIELLRLRQALAYRQSGRRDLRLDFLRGLAVSAMVVDHIGGDTPLTRLSGGNQAIVSAAEAFVFLSGLVLGIVYGGRIRRGGAEAALWGLVRRAATLYRASVGMALAFILIFLYTDLRMWHDRSEGLGVADPVQAVVGALTLHYSFHGSDVMVMYTIMMAVAPPIFYLMFKGQTRLVLLGSFVLWALFQRYPQEASFPWNVQNSLFQVAPWQLLLVLGIATGYHRNTVQNFLLSGTQPARAIVAVAAVGGFLLFWSEEAFRAVPLPPAWFGNTTYGAIFDKPGLGPGRVLTFLCVAVLAYTIVNALWVPLNTLLGWLMLPLGQNSLYVYVAHGFVLIAIYNLVPIILMQSAGAISPDNLNLGAQLLGLGVLYLMVRSQFLVSLLPQHGPHHTAD